MSYAPKTLLDARAYLKTQTGLSDNELGIVGDQAHGYGYHLGEDRLPGNDYSARTKRDIAGLTDAASATDIGMFKRLVELTAWLVGEARAGRTPDIREIIGPSLDGRAYRYDSLSNWSPQQRSQGDAHEWHTHISWYRDSEGRDKTALFKRFFEGGDMALTAEERRILDYIDGRIEALVRMLDPVRIGPDKGGSNELAKTLRALKTSPVDASAVAELLRPELGGIIKAALLQPEVLAAIAKAVTDEIGS